jgi:excinuclease ABC subunit A
MTVRGAADHFAALGLTGAQRTIAEGALREITCRLQFLLNVGLDYLTLDRSGPTLSGGEAQRIRLASQLGSELSGVMYVLDEPSIGLHQRDNQRLIRTLQHLRDLGNTVLVVEHDEDTIRAADHLVDFGPGAGHLGGQVVFFSGPPTSSPARPASPAPTCPAASKIAVPPERRKPKGAVVVRGAAEHNLQTIDVSFPLGVLCAVTGVSGAGKSSLVNGILLPALAPQAARQPRPHRRPQVDRGPGRPRQGHRHRPAPDRPHPPLQPRHLHQVLRPDPRALRPAPESRARGWKAGRFSFNVKGGRCEACQGDGVIKVEMHFLSDVYVPCEVCARQALQRADPRRHLQEPHIADILDTSVDDCLELFANVPTLKRRSSRPWSTSASAT